MTCFYRFLKSKFFQPFMLCSNFVIHIITRGSGEAGPTHRVDTYWRCWKGKHTSWTSIYIVICFNLYLFSTNVRKLPTQSRLTAFSLLLPEPLWSRKYANECHYLVPRYLIDILRVHIPYVLMDDVWFLWFRKCVRATFIKTTQHMMQINIEISILLTVVNSKWSVDLF